jgi:hypothetical protein
MTFLWTKDPDSSDLLAHVGNLTVKLIPTVGGSGFGPGWVVAVYRSSTQLGDRFCFNRDDAEDYARQIIGKNLPWLTLDYRT